MKLSELRQELPRFQARLRLQDWKLSVRWAKKGELADDEYGTLDPWGYPETHEISIVLRRGDGLHTMVHEMVHVKLEGHHQKERRYDPLYECAINHITDALLEYREPAC